ncbi:UNKNOWN [Stylonychia lemnae]|uniref:Transmembrane protein n=1 Tax=Stylonychia lemnae TaxID=5949 RepID=A0A078B1U4_STYLE|nr:UNKNOWN [Stylonychia lemnae]|eukprot:CDW88530.1 UNKNOWN [Stylonychia lemnae]
MSQQEGDIDQSLNGDERFNYDHNNNVIGSAHKISLMGNLNQKEQISQSFLDRQANLNNIDTTTSQRHQQIRLKYIRPSDELSNNTKQNNKKFLNDGYQPSESNMDGSQLSLSKQLRFEDDSNDDQFKQYYSSGFESNTNLIYDEKQSKKRKVKSWKQWEQDQCNEEEKFNDQDSLSQSNNNVFREISGSVNLNNFVDQYIYQLENNKTGSRTQGNRLAPLNQIFRKSNSIMKNNDLFQPRQSVQFNNDRFQSEIVLMKKLTQDFHSQNNRHLYSQSNNVPKQDNKSSSIYNDQSLASNSVSISQDYFFMNVEINPIRYFQMYFDDGNYLEEQSDDNKGIIHLQFLDASFYEGQYPRENWVFGKYIKKVQLNNSYILGYEGTWFNDYLDGDNCLLKINMQEWPQHGFEIPISNQIKEISLDKAFYNLFLCSMTVLLILLGLNFDLRILYGALSMYLLKWRPVVYLNYQHKSDIIKEKIRMSSRASVITSNNSNLNNRNNSTQKINPTTDESAPQKNSFAESMQAGMDLSTFIKNHDESSANSLIDLIDEFKYHTWADMSPEIEKLNFVCKNTQVENEEQSQDIEGPRLKEEDKSEKLKAKFVKLNIYKLFDFSTKGQAQLLQRKKAFAQYVFGHLKIKRHNERISQITNNNDATKPDHQPTDRLNKSHLNDKSNDSLQNLDSKLVTSYNNNITGLQLLTDDKNVSNLFVARLGSEEGDAKFIRNQGAKIKNRQNRVKLLSQVVEDEERSKLEGGAFADANKSIDYIDEDRLIDNIKIRKFLEGNFKEEILVCMDNNKSIILNGTFYFFLSMFCLGWITRMYVYRNTLQVNYYLKKVILD